MAERLRIIVCGGRKYRNRSHIRRVLVGYALRDPIIQHGGCSGADRLAADEAMGLGYTVSCTMADWKRHGNAAGPIRNQEMVDEGADLLIAFGGGKGTADCVRRAEKAGIPVRREP